MSNEYLEEFRDSSHVIFEDRIQGIEIWAGDLFEAKTVKGHTNLIVAMRVKDGHMFYSHGDKVKKTPIADFIKAIEWGDLQIRLPKEIDTDRLSQVAIGLDAIANRRTGQQQIEHLECSAEERLRTGHPSIDLG